MSDNIKVAIKVRPLIKREQDERLPVKWIVRENAMVHIDPETNKMGEVEFQFDYIFDMGQRNETVFDATVKPIVEAAMKGFNGTIFAYGQTGSGKTYTMMGTKEESGVIPLVVNYIFNYIRNDSSREFLLRVSYIEIYNERINDLLDKNNTDLKVKEDYHGHIVIDCKEEVTNSPECVLHAMRKGDKNRRTGETNMNDRSSRSHTIFRITIESCMKTDPDGTAKEAQLNLIDLAGSERARQTGATGERFNEGRHINLSLSTLSLVIKQLSESQSCSKYINFRDSKLTRILQPSLGGNAMTTIICAVTPAADDETQCTLAFAVRAKGIKNKPQINENVSDKALLKRIRTQKAKLEAEMQDMKTELAEKDKQLLRGRIALMNMQILTSNSQSEEEFHIKARRRRTWAGSSTGGTNTLGPSFALPTINECEQKSDIEVEELIQQENIYRMDVLNKSFQTAFEDFELQLIEDQREKNRLSDSSDCGYITVRPRVHIDEIDANNKNVCSPERTPERRRDPNVSDPSPDTPKIILREKIEKLRSDYETLREFTTLEKQLLQTDCIAAANQAKYEKNLAYITKSLADSEQMCKDLNKKYAELQSDHVVLLKKYDESTNNCEILTEKVKSLSSLRDTLNSLETERNDYKSKLKTASVKLKSLEDESASHAFEIDSLKIKHKNREKELEGSLNLAWKEYIDPNEKKILTDIIHLQSVIAELTAKITSYESKLNVKTQSTSFSESDFTLNSEQSDDSLKQTEVNKISDEKQLSNEFTIKIDEYKKRIEELERVLVEKDSALANINNESSLKFTEANDKLRIYENRIENMKIDIEQLQSDLHEKSNELSDINLRLNVILEESDKTSNDTQRQFILHKEQLEAAFSTIKMKELEIIKMKEIIIAKENELQMHNVISDVNRDETIDMNNTNDNLMSQTERRNSEIKELDGQIEPSTENLISTIKSHEEKINELLITNEKLRNQMASIQSDRTINDGDKIAMRTMMQEKDDKLLIIPKLENQLEFAMSEKIELEHMMSNLRGELNEKVLQLEKMQNYESEINNLTRYNASLQEFAKNLQDENDDVKKELESIRNILKILESEKKLLLSEIESLKVDLLNVESTQDVSRCENITQNVTINDFKSPSRVCQVVKPLNVTEPLVNGKKIQPKKNEFNVTHDDKESSSIFANGSYFDSMDMSVVTNEFINSECIQNFSTIDTTINNETVADNKFDESRIFFNLTFHELDNCLSEKNTQELVNIVKELFNIKTTLEEENVKLSINLQSKIREITEIKNDFGAFKLDFEKLQQTIILLTTENSDMTNKLTIEKELANQIQIDSQEQIDKLKMQIETLVSEKQMQETNIVILQDKVKNINDSITAVDDEKMKDIIDEYKKKIELLANENIKLSNNLMEKIEELENMKNKNSQEFVDYRLCRDRCSHLAERLLILENENIDLSSNLMGKIEELDVTTEKYETLMKNTITKANDEFLEKINNLTHLIEELKILNGKLMDLNVISCQCAPQAELHETQCAIQDNMKSLNIRLREFQENFNLVSAEAEKLKNKANEDTNISNHETSMNSSVVENLDISLIESKVNRLQNEYEAIHDNLQKWSLHNEKLCENNISLLDNSRQSINESPKSSKRNAKIGRRQCELEKYKIEQQQLTKTIDAFEKFQNDMIHMQHEIKNLRLAREMSKAKINKVEKSAESAQERVLILEERIIQLNNELLQARGDNKKITEIKLNLDREIENLKREKNNSDEVSKELRQSLIEARVSNESLQFELKEFTTKIEDISSLNDKFEEYKTNIAILENKIRDVTNSLENSKKINYTLESELTAIKSKSALEHDEVIKLTTTLQQYKDNIVTLETLVKELREKLLHYEKENENYINQIAKLENSENKLVSNITDNNMEICDESFTQNSLKDRIMEELSDIRVRIVTEIATLQQNELNSFNEKSVSELFVIFLTILMGKEQEMIKTLQRRHEREKDELIEQNKQCNDTEKRVKAWAKVLESDIERLQNDLTDHEKKKALLLAEITKLENLLMDSKHEKQLLNEKIVLLETDFNTLQADCEKYSKSNLQSDNTECSLIEREKLLKNAIENHEVEWKIKIAKVENEYKKRIDEISNLLETNKTKNIHLKRDLEALEANEQQLKSIIDVRTNELTKANNKIQHLEDKLRNLTEIYNQTNDDNQIKNQKIEEITILLKTKCDKMSEYKTNLETIKPEYELLKIQMSERQSRLETYKNELEKLRDENTQQISSMKDQLDLQEIKSAGLNKQLTDMINRNTVIQLELDQLMIKYQELERENERLIKKMRNSASKLTVEREMEDLRDENRTLLKNLEGATNRTAELQKHKNQLMTDHVELQGRYELVCQENNKIKNLIDNKIVSNNTFELRDKYDELLQEKNKIALELEEKRTMIIQLDTKLERLSKDNLELKNKNVELDEEMDDIVKKIHEMDEENAELQRKIYEMEDQNKNNKDYNKILIEDNSDKHNLQKSYEDVKKKLEIATINAELLKRENAEIKCKINNRNEGKRCGSSRSASPTPTNRSQQRRSDLFNQNRPLESTDDIDKPTPSPDCQCEQLRKKIIQLEQELVSKKARTVTLEMQIASEMFPYQVKCSQLEEAMLAYKQQNTKLLGEINELRLKKTNCDKCASWGLLRCNQSTQMTPKKNKIFLSGSSKSGVVEEYAMEQIKITKLESDKHILKKQLKRRIDEIAEMREKVKELQGQLEASQSISNISDKNRILVMKENVPANVTGQTKLIAPQRNWFN